MAAPILDQCPICRARLEGDGPCRRCRAELGSVRDVAEKSAALMGAALHDLATGDRAAALRKLGRARALRKAPDLALILSAMVGRKSAASEASPS
jgi:hypothetical protein